MIIDKSIRPDCKNYDIKIYAGTKCMLKTVKYCNLDGVNKVRIGVAVEYGFNIDDLRIEFKEVL